jgi:hypothetical protein
MTSLPAHLIASTENTGVIEQELPMAPLAFGVLAMVAFLVLLGVLWAFRGTANKIAVGAMRGTGPDHADHVAGEHASGERRQGGHH